MTHVTYEDREFHHLRLDEPPWTLAGISVRGGELQDCAIVQVDDPAYPIRVIDSAITGTQLVNSAAIGVRFEDITVTDCPTPADPVYLDGCLFRHVVLRGRLGSWIFDEMPKSVPDDRREAFAEAERQFYAEGEYALDISEAVFESASMFSLPGELVRRDPETQFLVRKEGLAGADLSMLPRSARRWLKRAARSPFDSTVLVVGRDEADFKESLALHLQLVDLGIAEA
ncbi:hypothetical protein VA596_47345 [Amycolatopsis sp., V23-08]|uniref:Uncharacterized protein n=1 Tax=Amycolatopsis heterodermiae TaxID=3110235 RepID=A0ABU5RLP4_9PSEU|nr:hypothetical protein [Amycolatopsis sp., V23-08]MEA5367215.1 hypothetical protein [Amycolatopsis sp., V23-08]